MGGEALNDERFRRLAFSIAPDRDGRTLQVDGLLLLTGEAERPFRFQVSRGPGADFMAAAQVFRYVGAALGRPSVWLAEAGAGSDCLGDPRFQSLKVEMEPSFDEVVLEVEVILESEGEAAASFGFPWLRRAQSDFAVSSVVFQKVGRSLERSRAG